MLNGFYRYDNTPKHLRWCRTGKTLCQHAMLSMIWESNGRGGGIEKRERENCRISRHSSWIEINFVVKCAWLNLVSNTTYYLFFSFSSLFTLLVFCTFSVLCVHANQNYHIVQVPKVSYTQFTQLSSSSVHFSLQLLLNLGPESIQPSSHRWPNGKSTWQRYNSLAELFRVSLHTGTQPKCDKKNKGKGNDFLETAKIEKSVRLSVEFQTVSWKILSIFVNFFHWLVSNLFLNTHKNRRKLVLLLSSS